MDVADPLTPHGRCLTLQAASLALGGASMRSMGLSMGLITVFFEAPAPPPMR